MIKTLNQFTFLIASLMVILLFITAKDYTQLAVGTILYFPVAYAALEIFPRKRFKSSTFTLGLPALPKAKSFTSTKTHHQKVDIADIDKRAFLKLIGGAGLSFFLFSLLNRRTDGLFSKGAAPETTAIKNTEGNKIDPAERQPTDGFRISEIDDSEVTYYGFTNKDGAWFIMREDPGAGSFRYTKGEAEFPGNWSRRESLAYDYYSNTF